jgi:hypothetical protein
MKKEGVKARFVNKKQTNRTSTSERSVSRNMAVAVIK